MDFSIWQIAIVLVIALLVFGPKRLPGACAHSAGNGMREFKDSVAGIGKDDAEEDEDDKAEPTVIESTATAEPAGEETSDKAPVERHHGRCRQVLGPSLGHAPPDFAG